MYTGQTLDSSSYYSSTSRYYCRLDVQRTHVCVHVCRGWLGLLLGQALWYAFYPDAVSTDEKFLEQMDALCNEVGEKGKMTIGETASKPRDQQGRVSEGVPPQPSSEVAATVTKWHTSSHATNMLEPAPEPEVTSRIAASDPDVPMTPGHRHTSGSFTPSMQSSSPATTHSVVDASLLTLMFEREEKMKQDAKAEADELRQQIVDLQTKMDHQREEMHAKLERQRTELVPSALVQAITATNLVTLQARFERLHAENFLSTDGEPT